MRLTYWQETAQIIKIHPIVGIEPGNFDLPRSRYAHNSYLQLWAETGMLGLIAFVWLIVAVFKSGRQNLRWLSCDKRFTGLVAANVIFLINNFMDFSFFLPPDIL